MLIRKTIIGCVIGMLFFSFAPFISPVFAHEVYVLNTQEISTALSQPPLDFIDLIGTQGKQFIYWGVGVLLLLALVFGLSLSRQLERRLDPFFFKIKPYAGRIAQATLGLALITSAYHGALFGAELPLVEVFGPRVAPFIVELLYIVGASILLGIYPRIGSSIAAIIFIAAAAQKGFYMTNYLTYFGEAFVILLFGVRYQLFKNTSAFSGKMNHLFHKLERYKFLLMRFFFGISLIYAAIYAKYIHGALALETVAKYQLTNYFNFDPLFLVFGAFVVELLIGAFFILAFEIRFTSLFFLVFLTMSLTFFGEAVWPHLILIGTALSMFVHGYDEFSIERAWYRKGKKEPVF